MRSLSRRGLSWRTVFWAQRTRATRRSARRSRCDRTRVIPCGSAALYPATRVSRLAHRWPLALAGHDRAAVEPACALQHCEAATPLTTSVSTVIGAARTGVAPSGGPSPELLVLTVCGSARRACTGGPRWRQLAVWGRGLAQKRVSC